MILSWFTFLLYHLPSPASSLNKSSRKPETKGPHDAPTELALDTEEREWLGWEAAGRSWAQTHQDEQTH
jgi:hypothetical protein